MLSGRLREVKNKKNVKRLVLKVVAVAYERCMVAYKIVQM